MLQLFGVPGINHRSLREEAEHVAMEMENYSYRRWVALRELDELQRGLEFAIRSAAARQLVPVEILRLEVERVFDEWYPPQR